MSEDKILTRVRKLLDQANHHNTSAGEREAFLLKVDELMVKHAIDEAMLASTQPESERRRPVVETVPMYDKGTNGQRFRTILLEVARTARVRCTPVQSRANDPFGQQMVTLVGFRDDVEYTQLLFTNIQYAFIAKIRPTWDPALPVGRNVYNFKVAGFTWPDIYETAQRNGVECSLQRETLWSPYDTYVRKNGLTKITTNRFGAYRETFADAFVTRICARLEEMRTAGAAQAASSGAELVLAHRVEEVDEEFYRLFPNRRPLTKEEEEAQIARIREQDRLEREKHAAWLASLTPTARAAYERKRQEEAQKQARANERYWRNVAKEEAARYDSAGMRAGTAAADSVNLNRTNPPAETQNRKSLS